MLVCLQTIEYVRPIILFHCMMREFWRFFPHLMYLLKIWLRIIMYLLKILPVRICDIDFWRAMLNPTFR